MDVNKLTAVVRQGKFSPPATLSARFRGVIQTGWPQVFSDHPKGDKLNEEDRYLFALIRRCCPYSSLCQDWQRRCTLHRRHRFNDQRTDRRQGLNQGRESLYL